jgi:Flp pilus assembly protein TadD
MRLPLALVLVPLLAAAQPQGRITIEYPLEDSLFPPDFAPPTFLFRDSAGTNTSWRAEVRFSDGGAPLRLEVQARWYEPGEIDYRAVADTNEMPKVPPEKASLRPWRPSREQWEEIKRRSVEKPATVVLEGFSSLEPDRIVSTGSVTIRTSRDPVGAPIFFRDVPLMPAQLERGVIKPLPPSALPLVAWRLRYVHEDESRLLIDDLPVCMNCHSFSRDGKTLGLDVDGPQNDKGLYALVPIRKETVIHNRDVIAWSNYRGKLGGKIRVGFMSQVSPDGQTVITMVNGTEFDRSQPVKGAGIAPELPQDVQGNFYVANFRDYRFLQVFYPTRGILAWYDRESRQLKPLPGADDLDYVHTNATWSPDGKWIVFARARARDAYPPGAQLAERANDPNETQIQYDLYRIPFNGGRGGKAEPIAGASANGMSNSFPKVSPDGKWIVFVQARNGLLMRPDSQLYIVPFEGGTPRRMNCNTPLMNSWHSFSPNGRWLVFSSKSRSPYTQMFLTHIDEQGNDSPPILIENATAANRAVNIPEFVNIGVDEWLKIDAPATEFYRISDRALALYRQGRFEEAIAEWKKALELDPQDAAAVSNLGAALHGAGRLEDAAREFARALELDPDNVRAHTNIGIALARSKKYRDAARHFERALELRPGDAQARSAYGGMLVETGDLEKALAHLRVALELTPDSPDALNNYAAALARAGRYRDSLPYFQKALEFEPNSAELHFNYGRALAASGDLKTGLAHVEKAAQLSGNAEPVILERLAELYESAGRRADALAAARRGEEAARARGDDSLASRLALMAGKLSRGQ